MAHENTVRGKIVGTERLGTSRNGNPYYSVTIQLDSGELQTFRVSIDSACNYGIENREYRDDVHTFHLSKANRIDRITD